MGDLDRAAYLEHRFSGSQRLVHVRETRLVSQLLSQLDCSDGSRVLDAPSGHGRFTELLRSLGEPVCVDADRRHLIALAEAERELGNAVPPRVELRLGEPLPFEDKTFDLVFCFRFLHHVREPSLRRQVLGELVRVSRQHLIGSYYQARSLHSLQKSLSPKRRGKRGLALISRRELRTLAAELGCEVVYDRAIFPGVHAQRIMMLTRV
jgi:SAM-dependent methyltransferase